MYLVYKFTRLLQELGMYKIARKVAKFFDRLTA